MRLHTTLAHGLLMGALAIALSACGDDDFVPVADGGTGGQCTTGQVLCDGACTNTQTSRAHCGACGTACDAGLVCDMGACVPNCAADRTECNGGCVDLDTDLDHCGACGTACAFANGDNACVAGSCTLVQCEAGFADCDGAASNGCERNIDSDPRFCGACDNACTFGADCTAGSCGSPSPAAITGDNFSVVELSLACTAVDHDDVAGDDRGGIGVTPVSFFINGDRDTVVMSSADLRGQVATSEILDGIIGDLKAGKVYMMTDAAGTQVDGSGDTFEVLVELDDMGERTATTISLSTPITTGSGIVFSGPGFGVLYDGGTNLQRVDFADGTVTELSDTLDIDNCNNNENWADYGVAEFSGGGVQLLYPTCSGVERVDVASGTVTTILDAGIDDLHAFTFEPTRSRWYWHHEDDSPLGRVSDDETGGYCEAVWTDGNCNVLGQLECDGSCIDVREDPANCGACGNVCGAGAFCADGVCDTCEEANQTNCSGTCRDTQRDEDNCGTCGTSCGGDTPFCVQGACSDASPSCESTGTSSGIFTIVPDNTPIEVYCENSDLGGQGGGWTLLGVFTNDDADNSWTPMDVNWTQATTFGTPTDPTINADAKSGAFNELPIDQLAIVRDGEVQVITVTECLDGDTLLSAMQTDSEDDSDCARSCGTLVQAGDWSGQSDQRNELALRCDDGDGGNQVDGFSFSDDDNSMITTLDNANNEDDNFGLGAGEGGQYVDWDATTDDFADGSDRTQILLFGR